jgi:hypothetical protein
MKEACAAYERSFEAAAVAPAYLRRTAGRWGRLARKQALKLI